MWRSIVTSIVLGFLANPAIAEPSARVMGLGVHSCDYWYTKVFRRAVHNRALQEEPTIYPYQSRRALLDDKEGEEAFSEALSWVGGYFAAAQQFSSRTAKDREQTTDEIVLRVFDVCRDNPNKKFHWAVQHVMPEFLK